MSDPTPPAAEDTGLPVSARIRARIQAARQRFHANDNIADFLRPGELEELLTEVEVKMKGVLESLVIDTRRTPRAAWRRCTSPRSSAAVTCPRRR